MSPVRRWVAAAVGALLMTPVLVAFAGVPAPAESGNWLIGTWTIPTGLTYVFTADSLTLSGPEGKVGPLKVTGYAIAGDTITVTADGLPGKATAKRVDDTHAVFDNGSDPPVTATKSP